MDYKELLRKYIAYVTECESVSFIEESSLKGSDIDFSKEEIDTLIELDNTI